MTTPSASPTTSPRSGTAASVIKQVFERKPGAKGLGPSLKLALTALCALFLAACPFGQGSEAVTRPEFNQLSGRVTNLEDMVISQRAGAAGPVGPGTPAFPGTPPAPQAAPKPTGSERSRYNQALSLLKAKKYAQAESAFRAFLTDFPNGTLSPNARYWLGESLYARGDFQGALTEFRQGARDYPQSGKAPDCLLKMAYSQSKLGDAPGAMESLRVLLESYPSSNSAQMVKSGRASFPK
ncbi:MAG: tol-pal system protein YbgF, partial [Deltaproteobacteria bacterium]|nr:tol-pal system protein YbgF [Deltaproteobacteria bacterium]